VAGWLADGIETKILSEPVGLQQLCVRDRSNQGSIYGGVPWNTGGDALQELHHVEVIGEDVDVLPVVVVGHKRIVDTFLSQEGIYV
jgi:hypothetical protein